MKLLVLFITLITTVNALTFTVASYNVRNLFDMKYQGNEYKEFIPNTKKWNQTKLNKKVKNIIDVLSFKEFDIICLQEIESKQALKLLTNKLPKYKYSYFYKKPKSAIGLSIISKYPIINTKIISVQKYNPRSRDILKTTLLINNKKLIIFINHWRSKKASESTRVPYAIALMKHIKTLNSNDDYIILGDLNSNYNEYKTFKYIKKLNNTSNITAINQILNTTINNKLVSRDDILNYNQIVHYNLWLDKRRDLRYSYIFRGSKETPDNIIISKGLFDTQNISYINNSFDVLYSKKQSDHLLIFASFSTNQIYKQTKKVNKTKLYDIESLSNSKRLKNLAVIYQINQQSAILKAKGQQAIYLYKCAKGLKYLHTYDINIDKINRFYNLLEITNISNVKQIFTKKVNVDDYILDGNKIDIFNPKYQNEIVKNIKGIYKKRYLHFKYKNKNKKIRIYAKDKSILPKNNQSIIIHTGHISIYKSKVQITLHKKSDFSINTI